MLTTISNKKASLFALIFVFILVHIGIPSLPFEWPISTSKNKPQFNTDIFTAELVGNQATIQLSTQKAETANDKSNAILEKMKP